MSIITWISRPFLVLAVSAGFSNPLHAAVQDFSLSVSSERGRYFVERKNSEVRFRSEADTFSIPINGCSRQLVDNLDADIRREFKKNPRLPLKSEQRLKGHVTVKLGPDVVAIPAHVQQGVFFRDLPESISRLWLTARRRCGK